MCCDCCSCSGWPLSVKPRDCAIVSSSLLGSPFQQTQQRTYMFSDLRRSQHDCLDQTICRTKGVHFNFGPFSLQRFNGYCHQVFANRHCGSCFNFVEQLKVIFLVYIFYVQVIYAVITVNVLLNYSMLYCSVLFFQYLCEAMSHRLTGSCVPFKSAAS